LGVCTRDIWLKQLSRLIARLEAATRHGNSIDSESTRMSQEIETFISASAAGSFDNPAVVSTARSAGDLLRDLSALQWLQVQLGCLSQLEVQLGCLIQLSGQSCLERERLGDEKNKVLKTRC